MGAGASSKADGEQPANTEEEVKRLKAAIESLRTENAKLKKESSHWQSELQELRVEHEHLNANMISVKEKNRKLFEQASFSGQVSEPTSPIAQSRSVKACDRLRVWLTTMELKDVLAEMTLEDTHVDKSKALPALGKLDTALAETREAFGVQMFPNGS
mmetsp:Transcript_44377/g.89078  ORF Transcript_44377/g.89078 Transcript_44377/m.89078 type:complete len:158 (-) Transcript_44377:94-567(-)